MFKDLVKKSRSYRSFDQSRKIIEAELREFVDCARFAPSSVNLQPLKYRLVFEEKELEILRPLTHWARALPGLQLPPEGRHATGFIVICLDTAISDKKQVFLRDVGIVAQTMILDAVEKGLAGTMIGNFEPEKVSRALNLPAGAEPLLIVAFGKPDEKIVLTEVEKGESVKYYRDENGVHYVPKRKLDDIII